MAGPTDLHDLAEDYLAACVEALDTIPSYAAALGGAPLRSFVSPGKPVADCCPQLTVHVQSVGEGALSPGAPRASFARINRVQLVATIFRCIPTGAEGKAGYKPPSPLDLAAAAEQIDADGWALWNHIFNLVAAGQLFTLCGDVLGWSLVSVPPSGGCGGWTLSVNVGLDGYQEVIST